MEVDDADARQAALDQLIAKLQRKRQKLKGEALERFQATSSMSPGVCCQKTSRFVRTGECWTECVHASAAERPPWPTRSRRSAEGRSSGRSCRDSRTRPWRPDACRCRPGLLRRFVNRLERVAVQQPVGKPATNQFASAQFVKVYHLGQRDIIGALGRREAIDTLVATGRVEIGPVRIEKPLQLFGTGDADVVEQLEAQRLHRALQNCVQGGKPGWQATLVHLKHTQLSFNLPGKLRGERRA